MDSSDDELFNVSPSYSKSINTSLNLATKQTNDLVQDSIKEKDCNNSLIKDISIKIPRLSNEMKINNEKTSTNLRKRKRKRSKWQFGSYKRKRTSKKILTQPQKEKSTTEVSMELLEDKIDDNAHLYIHSQEIKEKSCVAQQDVQDIQDTQENAENLTLSTFEAQKEDLCIDRTYICARVLPYEFHQKKNMTTSNNTTDIIAYYNFSSSSSNTNTEDNSDSNRVDQYYLSTEKYKSTQRAMEKLNEWKSKRKRSSSTSLDQPRFRRKRCRRISDESSDNEIAFESNVKMIGDDNSNKSYSSYERIDQEKSRPNIQMSHEARIILVRLEEMNDIDVIKWRASKIQNALKIIESQSIKEQFNKREQVTLKANKITLSDECNFLETQDIQDLSQKSIVSSTYVEKHCPAQLSDSLNMTKLRKKYKLFKKPKVLIIKLETLKNYFENGKYSAIEIDRLTKEYINFVIKSSSSKSRESFYGLANLQRRNKTGMNVTCMKSDNISYSFSGGQSMNKSLKQSDIDGNLKKDDQVMKSSSNENASVKFASTSSQNQSKTLSPKTLKSKNISQKTLLEIWRNAFCTEKSLKKSQETSTEQSSSAQSTSAKTISISRNSPKKLADAEYKNPLSSSLASTSTSSTKNNTLVKSPGKYVSPKKQELLQSTKCNKTSKCELFTKTSFPSNARVEETITKDDFLQSSSMSSNNTISKNARKNITEENVKVSDSSLNLSKKVLKKPSNLQSSINTTPTKMSKTSKVHNINQPRKDKFKCIICSMSFENYRLLQKHIATNSCKKVTDPPLDNALKHTQFTNNEKITTQKICQNGNKNSKSPMSQQNSSTNNTSDFSKSDQTLSNTDKEIISSQSSSPQSSGKKMKDKHLWTPQTKAKRSIVKTISNLNLRSRDESGPSKSQDGNKNSKSPMSQQNSSTNNTSDFSKSDQTLSNTDKEIISSQSSSPQSSGKKMKDKHLWTPQTKEKRSIVKTNSNSNLRSRNESGPSESQNSHSVSSSKGKRCTICLRFFDNYLQLFEHMCEHVNNSIKNTLIKNTSTHQTTDKNNRVFNTSIEAEAAIKRTTIDIDVLKKGLRDKMNQSNTDRNLPALEASQCDVAKKRDKTSNLLQAEMEQKEQSIPTDKDVENTIDRIRYVEREECDTTLSSKSSSKLICECHRPKTANKNNKVVQIEIVLLCETCQILFRRYECFETHSQRALIPSCGRNRKRNRTPKLLCATCQRMMNSIQDMQTHLAMHTHLVRKDLKFTFLCNICKVLFCSQGPLFNNHFHNHMKNRLFLASRLSFPRISYVGIKLIETLSADNEKQMEVYTQVADYKCQECNTPFISEQEQKSHEALWHNDNASSDDKNANLPEKILLICGFCNKTFYKKEHFELHSLEHKQKRDLHSHYTCVAVTAITKVFICKVCTTMWKSLKNFEEHWLTHDKLQEDYICSRCENHYDTIDLFQEHLIDHRKYCNAEKQHEPISCKVIYRDRDFEAKLQNTARNNNLPSTSLGFFDGKDSSEKTIADEIQEEALRTSIQQNMIKNKQFTETQTMILKNLLSKNQEGTSKEMQAIGDTNAQQKPQIPSLEVTKSKQTMASGKGSNRVDEKSKNSKNNSDSLDDSEEEELKIVMSESDESSMSSEIRRAGSSKSDDVSSNKQNDAQENATSNPIVSVSGEQRQCSSDSPTKDASAKTSGMKTHTKRNKTLNSNAKVNSTTSNSDANVSLTKDPVTQLEANSNVSQANETIVDRTNTVNSTTTTRRADNTGENSADSDSMSSSTKSTREITSNTLLPQNIMSSIPVTFKSLLRVKTLAELTQNYLCHVCGVFFDDLHKLEKHKSVHVAQNHQSADQAYPTTFNNVQKEDKSKFNPLRATQIQHHVPHSVRTGNPPLPGNASSSGNPPSSNNAPQPNNASQPNNAPSSTNLLLFSSVNPSGNVTASGNVNPSGGVHLPASVHPSGRVNPSGGVHLPASVHPSGNPSIRPLNRLISFNDSRQYQVAGVKPLHKVATTNKIVKSNELQQYDQWNTVLTNPIATIQQIIPQKQIYHQNLPPQIAYPINMTVRSAHQNTGTVAIRPFMQTLQVSTSTLPYSQAIQVPTSAPSYPQQQLQQQQLQQQQLQQQQLQQQQLQQLQQQHRQQQQQQHHQQHTSIGNNARSYPILSQESVPYQLAPNNGITVNSDNAMVMKINTMLQVSRNPDRYICIYCPGFECSSVEDFALHKQSSKHEAQSHYNNMSYNSVSRT